MSRHRAGLFLTLLLAVDTAGAVETSFIDLPLEDLGKLEVAAVSRKAQKLADTPAAVTVLSAEDIRRSGARSIPEALREVPGVNVAQIGTARWAVGVRGAQGRFANKLLVQVDGRSVYSPLFSGVFWEAQDIMIEDVERIEVVRGPGASLWGANAVNGVINIVTRKASATRGGLVSVSADSQGGVTTAVRQGVELGGIGAMRVFAKGRDLGRSETVDGEQASDKAGGWLAGFRIDGDGGWMLQGNSFRHTSKELLPISASLDPNGSFPVSFVFEGSNLLARRSWAMAGGDATLQAYVDHTDARLNAQGNGKIDIVDVDFQHTLAPMGRHDLMWGLGARYGRVDFTSSSPAFTFQDRLVEYRIASAFVQDEISLVPQTWTLTLGSRFEHSTLSDFETQPTARLMWTPTKDDSLWLNWSRAARTPSIGEANANVVLGAQPLPQGAPFPAVVLRSQPAPGMKPRAERVDALEFGYRRTLPYGSVEAVLFHHDYRRLASPMTDPAGFVPVPGFMLPVQQLFRSYFANARSTGLELAADITLTATLRVQGSYTVLDTQARHYADPVADAAGAAMEGAAPHHWASLHALWSPGGGHEFDLMLRRVGAVGGSVPAYTSVDARYGWRLGRAFDLAVVGQNLFDNRHLEYASDFFASQLSYQPRRAYIQGLWRF